MFKTNLKIAWRNLLKDRQFTFLNILGLSAGLACALLIFLWVNDELSVDHFFANDDRVCQLLEQRNYEGQTSIADESSGLVSETLKQQVPEIEYASPLAPPEWYPQATLSSNDKNIKASGQYAGKDYFNVFSFKLLDGNRSSVLASNSSIVISAGLAQKLFGTTQNLIGKPIQFQHDTTFFVSGVFANPPKNSSQQFDFVLSFDYLASVQSWVKQWGATGPHNFILLKKSADINAVNRKIANVINANTEDTTRKVFAAKFSNVYLNYSFGNAAKSGGRMEHVKLFSLIALFILVIACINFMNLSTAKASRRLKEIGIKKVVGAERKQLIFQFLSESLLLTLLAGIIALVLAAVLLPAFNTITGKQIDFHLTTNLILSFVAIIICTGLLAGSYPALYMSRFKPLSILKGKLNTSVAELLSRKGLVVFQFSLSTILIVAVAVIYQQIQFIQNANPGYNKDNIVRIAAEGNLQNNETSFISELQQIPGVTNASYTFHNMVGHNYGDYGLEWPGKDPNEDVFFEGFGVGYNFIETMGMQMEEGRSFSKNYGADSAGIIINEAAAKVMNLKNPVGTIIQRFGNNMQIIGIVKDFHFESMHEAIKPSYMFLEKGGGTIVARINQASQKRIISAIEKLYKKYNPGFPFTFNFLDEAYQKQYETETRTSILSKYFAGLAIIISCLGLFGLAAFSTQKRRKEIGIRKVIGASVANITAMLSFDFLKLIVLSLLIAFPVSWWLMNNWLQSFAYRISITPLVFTLAALCVLVITLATISFQSIKAAMANPVKSLRTE